MRRLHGVGADDAQAAGFDDDGLIGGIFRQFNLLGHLLPSRQELMAMLELVLSCVQAFSWRCREEYRAATSHIGGDGDGAGLLAATISLRARHCGLALRTKRGC